MSYYNFFSSLLAQIFEVDRFADREVTQKETSSKNNHKF